MEAYKNTHRANVTMIQPIVISKIHHIIIPNQIEIL